MGRFRAVLGATDDDRLEDIEKLYKVAITESHPDKHTTKSRWFQDIMAARAKDVNEAWAELKEGNDPDEDE